MTQRVKIILMDDIHLEGRQLDAHVAFRNEIIDKVNKVKEEGDIPIIIFAGDIGEGVNGINWFKEIKTDIVYVLGNHEFWGQDYYEELESIQELVELPEYKHINFLHNSSAIIHGIRFVGGTLWSPLGVDFPWYNKNYILRYHNVIGDFKRITAEKWYTEENIQRLKDFLLPHGVPESTIARTIEKKTFNPLLEKEESEKTADYIFKELSNNFDGNTIVVTHHLPFRENWIKKLNVSEAFLSVEKINDETVYLDVLRGVTPSYSDKDLLLLGLYTSNLSGRLRDVKAPDYWVHGHLHKPINDFTLGTCVKSAPVGYFKQSDKLSYKEFFVDGNTDEFMKHLSEQIESSSWNDAVIGNLRGFETTIYKFKELIDSHAVGSEAFFAIANAFVGNHEYSRKEIDRLTYTWLLQIYGWLYPNKVLEKTSLSILKELTGFNDFMEKHENSNDYKLYSISVKVDHHSFLEKEQFKSVVGKEYEEKRMYQYMNWLREINALQLNAIRYKKAFIEFIHLLPKKKKELNN